VCGEVDFLPFKSNSYDVVAINALLHHLSDIGPLLRETDRILRKGGYVIVAHEPNRLFFSSIFLRFAASIYKVLGQGKSITDEMQTEINKRLKSKNLIDVDLSKEYILKMVEYNSPVEQAKYAVPKDKGLIPSEIIDSFFSGYKLIQIREYTTFFIRPIFHRLKWLGKSVEFLSVLLLRKGNLFSFICQK
jgi:ubiquinone/menaquinone biosynthesis C-methylase UbiE